jgi:hypothetical protein
MGRYEDRGRIAGAGRRATNVPTSGQREAHQRLTDDPGGRERLAVAVSDGEVTLTG